MGPPYIYVYELRREDEVVATGRLVEQEELRLGDRVKVNRLSGKVTDIAPAAGGEWRLVIDADAY